MIRNNPRRRRRPVAETAVRWSLSSALAGTLALSAPTGSTAQTFPTEDQVIRRMWEVGIENSQAEALAQLLIDSIGPRLAGSRELAAAQEWLVGLYRSWGVPVRKEEYGTWNGWRQGYLHVDLIAPRVQTLEAEFLAWSPGTAGPVEGELVPLPEVVGEGAPETWLPSLEGRWVLAVPPERMCRAPQELEEYARRETVERLAVARRDEFVAFYRRVLELGGLGRLAELLDGSGALGVLTSNWSGGWGVNKVGDEAIPGIPSLDNMPRLEGMPSLDLSCEDYGLLYRMAERGQGPKIRVNGDAEALGVVPQFNVIAQLTGDELPDEYIVLSAHLDSWHAATGATDNGTGTITMLEAMRILKQAYPNPRRTILVGHWGPEEMGLIGSRAFTEDHPDVVENLQVLFNQDNGTWRIEKIEGQGLRYAGRHVRRWMSLVPTEISDHIELEFPGPQENRGSDHVSFLCHGAPAFRLQSPYDEYRQYTWHTNRDTYDKIVFDDLKENATLAAMLAYAASEDAERVPRDRSVLPIDPRTGEPRAWVECRRARRSPPSR